MTTTESKTMGSQTSDLLFAVSKLYSLEVSKSVIGDLRSMSCCNQEEMLDDLISKLNDRN